MSGTNNVHVALQKAAAICMLIAPMLQMLGDVVWVVGEMILVGSVIRQLSFILFVPAIIGLIYYLGRFSFLSFSAGWLCLTGISGGISILTLYRLGVVFEVTDKGVPIIVEQAFGSHNWLAISIFIPGVLFPLGHILLGIAFYKNKRNEPLLAAFLFAIGILFWIGNALDIEVALYTCNMLMILVYTNVGRKVWPGSLVEVPDQLKDSKVTHDEDSTIPKNHPCIFD